MFVKGLFFLAVLLPLAEEKGKKTSQHNFHSHLIQTKQLIIKNQQIKNRISNQKKLSTLNNPPHLFENKETPQKNSFQKPFPVFKKTEDNKKLSHFYQLNTLNSFFKENSPLIIHNKSLELLQKEIREPAILLLKRNLYHNFFIPSYFVLIQNQESVFFTPFLILLALFIISLIIFIYAWMDLKSGRISSLKIYAGLLSIFFCFLISSFFLKNKISFLEKKEARTLPFSSLEAETIILPGEELILLKKQPDWIYAQKSNKKKVWIEKANFFTVF